MTESRWRVEELAEISGTSVDTIRFYQKRRLLDAPQRDGRIAWYGPEHVETLARIRELRLRGLTLALIGRLVRGELDAADEPLAAAVATASMTGDTAPDAHAPIANLTIDDLAKHTSVPAAMLQPLIDAGLLQPTRIDGTPYFSHTDVTTIGAGMQLVGTGLPMNEVLDLARAHHERTRATAEQAVAMFDAHIRSPLRDSELSDGDKAAQLVDAFRVMLPAVTALVEHHFRQVLLAVAQEHLEAVGDVSELDAVDAETARMNGTQA